MTNSLSHFQHQSLEILERQSWGEALNAPTNLVRRCIELRKIPIADFSASDLRLMIGQQFGLPYLIPIAIEKLQGNLLVEADYYEGDLLSTVLDIDAKFWKSNPNYWTQVSKLLSNKRQELAKRKISITKFDSAHL